MANNCFNWVTFSGDEDTINRLEQKFKAIPRDAQISFSEFCDTFFDEAREKNPNDFDEMYNYGTKWWDYNIDQRGKDYINISGDSAWSPPTGFLAKLSKHYNVEIRGEYEEPGMDFGGYTIYKNGEVADYCYSYTEWRFMENPEGFWDDIADYVMQYDTFEEFKENVLDQFLVKPEKELSEIEEEFNRLLKERSQPTPREFINAKPNLN